MKILTSRKLLLPGILLLAPSIARAQIGWPEVFDPFQVTTIYLQIDPTDWNIVRSDTSLTIKKNATLWADTETPIAVTVKRKSDPAFPSEATPDKVSLKIDINALVPGQEWRGLKKLSLENSSGAAEGFAWALNQMASEAGFYPTPAGLACWVRLVVNGSYVGLYLSAEERDTQFLKNRGMWREGATWLYKVDGSTFIEAGTAPPASPTFDHLCFVPFISGPGGGGGGGGGCPQPDFDVDLPQWIDMDAFLTLAAVQAYATNGDALYSHSGKNSFAIDFLPENQRRRIYLPWDLDTGFGKVNTDIFSVRNDGPSEYEAEILAHPWWGQHYRYLMKDLLDGPLASARVTAFLDRLAIVLDPLFAEDPNSSSDIAGLGDFVVAREANIRTQLGPVLEAAEFSQAGCEVASGFPLTLSHTNASGTIYYTTDGSDPRVPGGAASTSATTYSEPLTINSTTPIQMRVKDGAAWSALRSATFSTSGHAADMRITEIMYHPKDGAMPDDGEDAEFVELKNTGAGAIDLSDCHFDGLDYSFPPGTIALPGQIILLVKHPLVFAARYPGVSFDGTYWSGLSNKGEKLRLRNADGNNIVSAAFENASPWPQAADGMGRSLVLSDLNGDPDRPATWRASSNPDGSPGTDDPAPPYQVGIVINEILAHTDPPLEDAIELHNTTAAAIDIGGWYLSDDLDKTLDPSGAVLKKILIPAATVIPPGGYKVFYEAQFNAGANGFKLSSRGEAVYLSSGDGAGNLTGHIVSETFGATDNGRSLGRYQTSDRTVFTALAARTFGADTPNTVTEFRTGTGVANAQPVVADVVINEIMYHPDGTGAEWVELHNTSTAAADLTAWQLGGLALTFPAATEIPAGGFLLVVDSTTVTPAQFRIDNNVPVAVPILGHVFVLDNDGESIELRKPNGADPAIVVGRVRYNDKVPWPTEADGAGASLERFSPTTFGDDPANWGTGATPGGSPGRPNVFADLLAIASKGNWQYNSACQDLGTPWRTSSYTDSSWQSGRGALGFGDPVVTTPTLAFGASANITTYFRKALTISAAPSEIATLHLEALYDDGIVVYLNGVEVARRSLPAGAITSTTLATSHAASSYEIIDLSGHTGLLVRGENVVAVEVHMAGTADTDLVWDAALTYTTGPVEPDTDLDGMPDSWETANGLDPDDRDDASTDLDGDGSDNLNEFLTGTDPTDRLSVLELLSVAEETGDDLRIRWSAVPGETYELKYSYDLVDWLSFTPAAVATATGGELDYLDQNRSPLRRFYRAQLLSD